MRSAEVRPFFAGVVLCLGDAGRIFARGLLAGAGGKMAVAAVLVGGKPVARALKGLIPKCLTAD
jgi:hypothetical protein